MVKDLDSRTEAISCSGESAGGQNHHSESQEENAAFSAGGPCVQPIEFHSPGIIPGDCDRAHLGAQGATTLRFRKPTFSRPAPAELIEQIAARADLAVEALAD